MNAIQARHFVKEPTRTAAGKKFGRYKEEQEKRVRKAEVKEDRVLRELKKAWRTCGYEKGVHFEEKYLFIVAAIENIPYSSEDVEKFSIALAEFQDESDFSDKSGFFLSALINNGKDVFYTVHTTHLERHVTNLGFKNMRSITVKGDLGEMVGHRMQTGTIAVEGNVGNWVGTWMEGGHITVKGDAGVQAGNIMKGGKITIKGNADIGVGLGMEGGVISIEGDVDSFDVSNIGGSICYKGKMIVKNGKPCADI